MLLREAGFEFQQMSPPFADPAHPQGAQAAEPASPPVAATLAMELAREKAVSLARRLVQRGEVDRPTVLLGADTICVASDGSLIGQPIDAEHARRMIRSFVGATHDVVSGVALLRLEPGDDAAALDDESCETFADTVPVTFGDLADDVLDAYIAGGQWRGKAGGYNLFDRQAAGWPITVPPDADATTVVGLPMRKLVRALQRWGVEPGRSLRQSEATADPRRAARG